MPDSQPLSDRLGPEWLVHPLLLAARGYLTDEDYVAVEATLGEAVERAKDLETEVERLRAENEKLTQLAMYRDGVIYKVTKIVKAYEDAECALPSTTKEAAP